MTAAPTGVTALADPSRRSFLLARKLAALVRDHAGPADGAPQPFPGGAALVRPDGAWVLVDDRPDRAVGAALVWASSRGLEPVHVLVDGGHDGVPARRAGWFAPAPQVWRVHERVLRPGRPAPLPAPASLDRRLAPLRALIEAGGAEPVEEGGGLAGEVLGLEVCRAVVDPVSGEARLEVGVGAHDREAFQLLHGGLPPVEALAGVVARVAALRADASSGHPLRRLGAERLLRWQLTRDPHRIALAELAPAPPPVPRGDLREPVPCVARGLDGNGCAAVVVCSVGIDPELVPFAADARTMHGPPARLIIAVPARDDHPATRALAARLASPADVVTVDIA